MDIKCIVKIINKETGKEVLLYHNYDGYIAKNSGVAFDICDAFYNKETKNLDLPLDSVAIVNAFLKGKVGDGDMEYKYCESVPTDIDVMYTIVCSGITTNITAQGVGYTSGKLEFLSTWNQDELVKLYRSGIVEPITDGQKAAIYIIRKCKLNWSTQRYKNLLKSMFYVESCQELNTEQADMLINTLNSLKEV